MPGLNYALDAAERGVEFSAYHSPYTGAMHGQDYNNTGNAINITDYRYMSLYGLRLK